MPGTEPLLASSPLSGQTSGMNIPSSLKSLPTACLIIALGMSGVMAETSKERTIIVRERNTASVLDGAFSFKLLKMKGYSVDIRVDGTKRTLKFGDAITPPGTDCTVVFHEISPETRIARFLTDCP